jgi:hypothetical protein
MKEEGGGGERVRSQKGNGFKPHQMSAMFPQRAPTKKKGVATTEQLLYNYYTDNNQQCSGKKEKRSSTMYI